MDLPLTQLQTTASDDLLDRIADYVCDDQAIGAAALHSAHYCLLDALGCGLLALDYSDCRRMLGPVVPGAELAGGARVVGTAWELDPVQAAFNTGALIRWLDFNDTWLAQEWGHPSDNFGAILALADYLARRARREARPIVGMQQVLEAAAKAYEIQGILALENAFNRRGLDHVMLVRIASAAVASRLLGGDRDKVRATLSHAFIDGGNLRCYRHAPNTGSRKSWAAGDATARGVWLALMTERGEPGYASPLSAPQWGFDDVLFGGQALTVNRSFGSYVIENVLFKLAAPAEFHAQTAVEAAMRLHPQVIDKIDRIRRIHIETQQPAIRIIDKSGPLHNPADRDHCLQYMVAVPLLKGSLSAQDYLDATAADPRIDRLRAKMEVRENPRYSADYLDPQLRAIGNAVQVEFDDGSCSERIEIHYPVGHKRRREEGIPLLAGKFRDNLAGALPATQTQALLELLDAPEALRAMPVDEFMQLCTRQAPG